MRLQEQKIKLLRVAKGLSQAEFADAIYADQSKISKCENGLDIYTEIQLDNLKKFLGIKDMPLSDESTEVFNKKLRRLYENIRDGRAEEAKALHKEMARLVNLEPCDDNLPMLYRLHGAALHIYVRNDFDTAEKEMNYLKGKLEQDMMTDEHKYHYCFNMGALHTKRVRYEESLECFMQALEISKRVDFLTPKDIKRLHLGIASCYSYLSYPYRAIIYMLETRDLHKDSSVSIFDLHFDYLLALNYIRVNELERAEKLLGNCLIGAKSINNDEYIGMTLRNFGLLHIQSENWDKAIDYLNQSMGCFEKGSTSYLRSLYDVVSCWAGMKKYAKAKRILDEAKNLYHNHDIYHIPFNALNDYVAVKSRISLLNQPVEYIETVAIPHFEKTYDHYLAIDYYKLLETYNADKNVKKSLLMTDAIRKIYERCFLTNEGRKK
ncbi:MAG: helix-turn-helix transcriptional regulator [Defluviitaleaceae bacterium]|nr:helix-turn-helix transcriptional regulator [Defluviitaleaceae bacterium]